MLNLALSAYDSLLDMSADELLGALLLGALIAMTLAGVFALLRKRVSDAPALVGGLVLAACSISMAASLGFAQFKNHGGRAELLFSRTPATGSAGRPAEPWTNGPHAPGFPPRRPAGFGSFLSAVAMEAFDRNHDGRLTRAEGDQALSELLKDADGRVKASLERGDLESLINRRLQARESDRGGRPGGARSTARILGGAPVVHSSSGSSSKSG